MVFCNNSIRYRESGVEEVTILILIDGFLQLSLKYWLISIMNVTILILIDGFLQYVNKFATSLINDRSQSLF